MVQSGNVNSKISSRIAALKSDVVSIENSTISNSGQPDGPLPSDPLLAAQQQVKILSEDLQRRQESYVRRERGYRTKIEDLETELRRVKGERTSWMDEDDRMALLRDTHKKIVSNISNVHDRTKMLLQEQERDLLRAFRARLFDVQSELEREKTKSNDGASVWIEKNRQLERDLEWARQMADRLERVNQSLSRENSRFKGQFKTQEEDREFLIRQLVAVKKDNARLKQEVEEFSTKLKEKEELGPEKSERQIKDRILPIMESVSSKNIISATEVVKHDSQQDNRYKEIVKRLKKLLESERTNLRKLRHTYSQDLQERTELETLLRLALQDVKREIAQKRTNKCLLGPVELSTIENNTTSEDTENPEIRKEIPEKLVHSAADISVSEFDATYRERTLEILLSQERVFKLLYSKTFPNKPDLEPAPSKITPQFSKEDLDSIYKSSPLS